MEKTISRRSFLKFASAAGMGFLLGGCMKGLPKNTLSLFERSMDIRDSAALTGAYNKGRLFETNEPKYNSIQVLTLEGSPYEMGFQHGKLIKERIHQNYRHVMKYARMLAKDDMLDEAYDLIAPYIPEDDVEEMRGLAHGAEISLKAVHWFHTIPEISEYKFRKRFLRESFQNIIKGPSCSNIAAFKSATIDEKLYQIRILDWTPELEAQYYPAILIHKPDNGFASVTFSFAGFIGCVSGMNLEQLALGEMGHGDKPYEDMQGMPFIFMFRKIMREADNLKKATQIINDTKRTMSYVHLIGDGKVRDAQIYDTTREYAKAYSHNTDLNDYGKVFPAIEHIVYGGHYPEIMHKELKESHGKINEQALMNIAKKVALKSNIQDIVFCPETLEAWAAHASGTDRKEEHRAYSQAYFHLDVQKYL